jgi:hypothetical protein
MSYSLGGIGIPHLDDGDATPYFALIASSYPTDAREFSTFEQMKNGFRFDHIRARGGVCPTSTFPDPKKSVIMVDLYGNRFLHDLPYDDGPKYCPLYLGKPDSDPKHWQIFRTWARNTLRSREIQAWIVNNWLRTEWKPAYEMTVIFAKGEIQDAFVMARIWNTGAGTARRIFHKALSRYPNDMTQRVAFELNEYGNTPTHRSRRGVMQRPAVTYSSLPRAMDGR